MARDGDDARTRAQEYAESKGSAPAPKARPKSEADWRDAVEEAIEDAIREGKFDSLAGRGKPLNLERDPFAPEGSEMAYGILRNNDLSPGWIGARSELLREIERWRLRLRTVVARHAAELAGADPASREMTFARWQQQRELIGGEVRALNKRIRDLNLQQPVSHLEVFMLRLEDELKRAGAGE